MKRFRVTFSEPSGKGQRVTLMAKNRNEAEKLALAAYEQRHGRFPKTFERLDAIQHGDPSDALTSGAGLMAIDPKFTSAALTEAWVKAERERRKFDQGRYDDGRLKIAKIEEVK